VVDTNGHWAQGSSSSVDAESVYQISDLYIFDTEEI